MDDIIKNKIDKRKEVAEMGISATSNDTNTEGLHNAKSNPNFRYMNLPN